MAGSGTFNQIHKQSRPTPAPASRSTARESSTRLEQIEILSDGEDEHGSDQLISALSIVAKRPSLIPTRLASSPIFIKQQITVEHTRKVSKSPVRSHGDMAPAGRKPGVPFGAQDPELKIGSKMPSKGPSGGPAVNYSTNGGKEKKPQEKKGPANMFGKAISGVKKQKQDEPAKKKSGPTMNGLGPGVRKEVINNLHFSKGGAGSKPMPKSVEAHPVEYPTAPPSVRAYTQRPYLPPPPPDQFRTDPSTRFAPPPRQSSSHTNYNGYRSSGNESARRGYYEDLPKPTEFEYAGARAAKLAHDSLSIRGRAERGPKASTSQHPAEAVSIKGKGRAKLIYSVVISDDDDGEADEKADGNLEPESYADEPRSEADDDIENSDIDDAPGSLAAKKIKPPKKRRADSTQPVKHAGKRRLSTLSDEDEDDEIQVQEASTSRKAGKKEASSPDPLSMSVPVPKGAEKNLRRTSGSAPPHGIVEKHKELFEASTSKLPSKPIATAMKPRTGGAGVGSKAQPVVDLNNNPTDNFNDGVKEKKSKKAQPFSIPLHIISVGEEHFPLQFAGERTVFLLTVTPHTSPKKDKITLHKENGGDNPPTTFEFISVRMDQLHSVRVPGDSSGTPFEDYWLELSVDSGARLEIKRLCQSVNTTPRDVGENPNIFCKVDTDLCKPSELKLLQDRIKLWKSAEVTISVTSGVGPREAVDAYCRALKAACEVRGSSRHTKGSKASQSTSQSTLPFAAVPRPVPPRSEQRGPGNLRPSLEPLESRAAPRQSTSRLQQIDLDPEGTEPESIRRSSRHQPRLTLEEPPVEVDKTPTDTVVLMWPFDESSKENVPGAVSVTHGDVKRLRPEEFLNDTLIEYGLKSIYQRLDEERRNRVHMFNSFFYKKLSARPKKEKGIGEAYQSLRKWTAKINIFEKDYIVVPINEHLHWYLAIIVNPAAILQPPKQSRTESAPPPSRKATRASTGGAELVKLDDHGNAALADPDAEKVDGARDGADDADDEESSPLDKGFFEAVDAKEARLPRAERAVDVEGEVDQEVDQLADDTASEGLNGDVEQNVTDLLRKKERSEEAMDVDADSSGKTVVQGDSDDEMTGNLVPPPSGQTPTADEDAALGDSSSSSSRDAVATELLPQASVHTSIEPLPALSHSSKPSSQSRPIPTPFSRSAVPPVERHSVGPPSAEASTSKLAKVPKDDELAFPPKNGSSSATLKHFSKDICYIYTFDSLGNGRHKPVENKLRAYLVLEAKDKQKKLDSELSEHENVLVGEAKVPQQDGYCDCGLYLLHFVDQVLNKPCDELWRHILNDTKKPDPEAWDASDAPLRRGAMLEEIARRGLDYSAYREPILKAEAEEQERRATAKKAKLAEKEAGKPRPSIVEPMDEHVPPPPAPPVKKLRGRPKKVTEVLELSDSDDEMSSPAKGTISKHFPPRQSLARSASPDVPIIKTDRPRAKRISGIAPRSAAALAPPAWDSDAVDSDAVTTRSRSRTPDAAAIPPNGGSRATRTRAFEADQTDTESRAAKRAKREALTPPDEVQMDVSDQEGAVRIASEARSLAEELGQSDDEHAAPATGLRTAPDDDEVEVEVEIEPMDLDPPEDRPLFSLPPSRLSTAVGNKDDLDAPATPPRDPAPAPSPSTTPKRSKKAGKAEKQKAKEATTALSQLSVYGSTDSEAEAEKERTTMATARRERSLELVLPLAVAAEISSLKRGTTESRKRKKKEKDGYDVHEDDDAAAGEADYGWRDREDPDPSGKSSVAVEEQAPAVPSRSSPRNKSKNDPECIVLD